MTVTNVRTGLPRVFRNADVSLDALVASASLPQLFQAIEIDGEPYWDGGYSGNPTLRTLVEEHADRDVVIVQLTPDGAADAPRDAAGIQRRVNEIVFNASLVAEIQSLAALRVMALGAAGTRAASPACACIASGRRDAALLAEGSPLDRSPAWIARLRDHGRQAARRFLLRHHDDLGVRETLDVAGVFDAVPAPDATNAGPTSRRHVAHWVGLSAYAAGGRAGGAAPTQRSQPGAGVAEQVAQHARFARHAPAGRAPARRARGTLRPAICCVATYRPYHCLEPWR